MLRDSETVNYWSVGVSMQLRTRSWSYAYFNPIVQSSHDPQCHDLSPLIQEAFVVDVDV